MSQSDRPRHQMRCRPDLTTVTLRPLGRSAAATRRQLARSRIGKILSGQTRPLSNADRSTMRQPEATPASSAVALANDLLSLESGLQLKDGASPAVAEGHGN